MKEIISNKETHYLPVRTSQIRLLIPYLIHQKKTRKRASIFTGTFSRLLRVYAPYRDEQ